MNPARRVAHRREHAVDGRRPTLVLALQVPQEPGSHRAGPLIGVVGPGDLSEVGEERLEVGTLRLLRVLGIGPRLELDVEREPGGQALAFLGEQGGG